MPQLIISIEGDYPKIFEIQKGEVSIGRHSENDIQLPFNFISSFHAQLTRESDGRYRLTDRGSHNGTTVNGNNLGSALLEDGDQISLGGIRAAYRASSRRIEEPSAEAPKPAAPASESAAPVRIAAPASAPAIKETAPIAVPATGQVQALSEVELQIRLREKVQQDIAKEFDGEIRRIDELKRISAELGTDNAEARARLAAAEREAEKIEKAAAVRQSEMAMREHLVRDLEKARAAEQEKLREAQSRKEELEREHRILQHELTIGAKELEQVRQHVAEGREAAGKAEAAFKKTIEFETRAVRLDTEVVARERRIAELEREQREKQDRLLATERELQAKLREVDEVGGARLLDLKKEIEQLGSGIAERKNILDSLEAKRAETEKAVADLQSRLDAGAAKLDESRRAREEAEKELGATRLRADSVLRQIEEQSGRNQRLAGEQKQLEDDLGRARKERDDLETAIGEKKRAAHVSEEDRRKIEELRAARAQLETDLAAQKEQLASVDADLASKRRALAEAEASLGRERAELEDISTVRLVKLRAEAADIARDTDRHREKLEALRKEAAAREAAVRDGRARLEELDAEIAGRRKSLLDVEKEIASRRKALGKLSRWDRFKAVAAFGGEKAAGSNGHPSNGEEETAAAAATAPSDEGEASAQANQRAALEKENCRLSELIAEKSAALRQLEDAIAARGESDGSTGGEITAATSRRLDRGRAPGNLRAPAPPLENRSPDRAHKPESTPSSVEDGIALLNTGGDLPEPVPAAGATAEASEAAPKEKPAEPAAPSASPPPLPPPAPPPPLPAVPAAKKTTKEEEEKRFTIGASGDAPLSPPRPPGDGDRAGRNGAASPATPSAPGAGATAADESEPCIPPLRIVHPRAKEMVHEYRDGAGAPDPQRHPPVGLHALAACTRGSVHRTVESLPSGDFAALVLLGGSLEKDREVIQHVSREIKGRPLLACWREGRLDHLAGQLQGGSDFQQFTEMLGSVDGLISTDRRTSSLLDELHVARRYLEIPLPCPIDARSWDVSIPLAERERAIFVAADGFQSQSEEHKARVDLVNALADKHRLKVTVYHHLPDILAGLEVPADRLTEPNRTLTYGEFLALMARHRFVVGFGKNLAGGEVWGDALLTRTVCLGSHGALESILFSDTSFAGGSADDIREQAAKLLEHADAYEASVAETRRRALGKVSFHAVRARLAEFLGAVSQELLTIG